MGSIASKHKGESSSAVIIVLVGGKREMYSRPVCAQEVMLKHPQHLLTHFNVPRSDSRKALVAPETVLMPGKKYYLVRRRTVEWLLDDVNTSPSNKSDSSRDSSPTQINMGSYPSVHTDDMSMASQNLIIMSPWHSPDGAEQKPNMTLTEEPLQTAREKSWKATRPKSPLAFTRSSESSPRRWRSSPKVCPREDDFISEGHISDAGVCMSSPDQTCDAAKEKSSPLMSQSSSMQPNVSSKQEAPAYNVLSQSPASIGANKVNNAMRQEEHSTFYQQSPSLQKSMEACKNQPLSQFLKFPDINITSLVEGNQQCIPFFALKHNTEVYQSSEQNISDSPEVEPAEGRDHIGVMSTEGERSALDDVPHLHELDEQHTWPQSCISQEPLSHLDLGGLIIDKIPNAAQAYNSNKGLEDNTILGNTPIAELGLVVADEAMRESPQMNECSTLSEMLLTDGLSIGLRSVMGCERKDGSACMHSKNMPHQPTPNLECSLSEESIQLCQSGEVEAPVLVCQTTHDIKAVDVNGSNNKNSCVDVDKQPAPRPGDILSKQSANHLGLLVSRVGKNDMCGTGDETSSSSVLPPPSTSCLSSSSSSSFSVNSYAKTQRNLAILGFSSLHSTNMTIFEQAMAHRRAHLGVPPKITHSSMLSSSEELEQEQLLPIKQPTMRTAGGLRSTWLPTFSRSRRFREIVVWRHKKPLSPVLEVSPELSPASPSA